MHLAAKERELVIKQCTAIRDGLGARIRALMECRWVWSEVGKEASAYWRSWRPSIIRPSSPSSARECDNDRAPFFRFFLHCAFSVRLQGDVESRLRGTTAFRVRRYTPRHQCSPVRRTCFSLHSDNDNSRSTSTNTRTGRRVQPRPPSGNSTTTTGSSIRYIVATLATYTFEIVTYAQAIQLHVSGSGAVVANELDRERNRTRTKAEKTPPTSAFLLPTLSKREPIRTTYFVFLYATPEMRICTRQYGSPRCMRLRTMRRGY